MCEQETIFNLMKKNGTVKERKSLDYAYREAAIKDYKTLKKEVDAIKDDVTFIKNWVDKQNGVLAGFKWFANSKLGAIIVLAILAKFIGVEVYQAVAQPVNVAEIIVSKTVD